MPEIPDDRDLTQKERFLTRWLLEHGRPESKGFVDQVDRVRVVSKCQCGCASVNYDQDGRGWKSPGGLQILSDFRWQDQNGRVFGVFVFAKDGALAGLEVWSVDGLAIPAELPEVGWLQADLIDRPSNTALHRTAAGTDAERPRVSAIVSPHDKE